MNRDPISVYNLAVSHRFAVALRHIDAVVSDDTLSKDDIIRKIKFYIPPLAIRTALNLDDESIMEMIKVDIN